MTLFSKLSIALFQLKLFQDCQFKDKISRVCSLYKYLNVFLKQCWQNFSVVVMTAITAKRITLTTVCPSNFIFSFTFCRHHKSDFDVFLPPLHEPTFQAQARISFRVQFCKSTSALDIVPRSHFSFLVYLIYTSSISLTLC